MREPLAALRELRYGDPAAIRGLLSGRATFARPADGRLLLLAADHPARGALGAGDRPMAMGDREQLLERLMIGLARPGVDGVLGTADILEDLVTLGALDGKLAVGSMNRGGLRGSVFELDDRITGYTVNGAVSAGLDMLKLLLRIDLDDPGTVRTLAAAARTVSEAADAGIGVMIEPFMSARRDGQVVNELTADAMVAAIAIASGLGTTSAFTWLKLPVVEEMERVMAATTLPTLLLGGELDRDVDAVFARWERALALPGVRGMVVGRTLLYPEDDDVARAVDATAALVHDSEERND